MCWLLCQTLLFQHPRSTLPASFEDSTPHASSASSSCASQHVVCGPSRAATLESKWIMAPFCCCCKLGGRFGYFLFFLLGEGKGESEAPGEGGGSVFYNIENPGGGLPGQEGLRGQEGVCCELGNCLGRGLNFFWGGRNVHQVKKSQSMFLDIVVAVIWGGC